jgi:ornithine decarboxylase
MNNKITLTDKPYFTISKSVALEKYAQVANIADIVSYSSKTNPAVTPILEENTDCWFSIHMPQELINVMDASRVLFLVQAWDDAVMQQVFDTGVRAFCVDNEPDLDRLLAFIDGTDYKVILFLRTKLKERSVKTERNFVFGIESKRVNVRIAELQSNTNLQALGVHFHRKTQNMAEWNLSYELNTMFTRETFDAITYMNIGGGLPSVYANTNIDAITAAIEKIKELKDFLVTKKVKMIIEPGRFICAPAGKLYTRITGIYDLNIIVNASVYNSDFDAAIVPVKLLVKGEGVRGEEGFEPYVVKGCTPCPIDLFRYRVYLKNPSVGDELVFINAGAYTFASDFCNLETPEVRIIE